MCVRSVVCVFVFQDLLPAESVDECGTTWIQTRCVSGNGRWRSINLLTRSAGTAHHQTELDTLLHILLATNLDTEKRSLVSFLAAVDCDV